MGRTQRLRKRIRRLERLRHYDKPRWLVMPTRPGHEDRCRHDSKDYIRAGYQCPDADENGNCNDIPF